MARKRVTVRLTKRQREKLERKVRAGRESARVQTRCRILLMIAKGRSVTDTAEALNMSYDHCRRVVQRFEAEGLEGTTQDKGRSGRPRRITMKERQEVIATVCSPSPDGRERWTIRLLVEHMGKKGIRVGREWVRQALKEDELKPWREKNVEHAKGRRRISAPNE